MKDTDLKRNASGYYDEPCYKAITAAPKPGEIWTHNQSGAYMLVVANVNGVCPTLRLSEQQKDGSIAVTCRVPMYANPAFVGYVFETNLAQYVKTVKEDEFKVVKQGIADVLGITATAAVPHDHINALEAKVLELGDMVARLQEEKSELMHEKDDLLKELRYQAGMTASSETAKMSQEIIKLKVYKDMYMDLIDKLVAVRGGTVND